MATALHTIWPGMLTYTGSINPAVGTPFSIASNTSAYEVIFQSRTTDPITKLGFCVNQIINTPPIYKISLQGVSSGVPDGTIKGGGSPASATFDPTGYAGFKWVTLDHSYTPSRGEKLALVIARDSGTADASNCMQLTPTISSSLARRFPFAIQNASGSRTTQTVPPAFGYGTASNTFGMPVSTVTQLTYHSGTTVYDEYGIYFSLPTNFCSTYQVAGVSLGFMMNTSSQAKVILENLAGTVLQDMTIDAADTQGNGNAGHMNFLFDESTLSTLTAGTSYRLWLQPQNTNTIQVRRLELAAAADMDALPGGQNIYMTSRLNGAGIVDTTTWRMNADLLLADLTPPSPGAVWSLAP